jgi:hypothetical protein
MVDVSHLVSYPRGSIARMHSKPYFKSRVYLLIVCSTLHPRDVLLLSCGLSIPYPTDADILDYYWESLWKNTSSLFLFHLRCNIGTSCWPCQVSLAQMGWKCPLRHFHCSRTGFTLDVSDGEHFHLLCTLHSIPYSVPSASHGCEVSLTSVFPVYTGELRYFNIGH